MATEVTVGKKKINDLELSELRDMLISKEVEFPVDANKKKLIDIIYTCGKFDVKRPDGSYFKDGKLYHKDFGEYIRCVVHPQSKYNQNGAIYVGLNQYSVMINPRVPVKLPKKIIKFLNDSTEAYHTYDKTAVSENGNIGAHVTLQRKKYVVEILLDDDVE